jgi:hypothetical protein
MVIAALPRRVKAVFMVHCNRVCGLCDAIYNVHADHKTRDKMRKKIPPHAPGDGVWPFTKAGAIYRHGFPDEDTDWTLVGNVDVGAGV